MEITNSSPVYSKNSSSKYLFYRSFVEQRQNNYCPSDTIKYQNQKSRMKLNFQNLKVNIGKLIYYIYWKKN